MDIVIKNITLIDGTGRASIENAVVTIREGKVFYTGSASEWSDAAGENVTYLDLRGEFAGPRMCLAGRFISITEAGADYYIGMDEVRKAVREQVKHGVDLIKMGVTGAVCRAPHISTKTK